MKEFFYLKSDYITLGQFLKEIAEISSGGMAKHYLQETNVLVNEEPENRRGRKLYADMSVTVPNRGLFFMKQSSETDNTTVL